MILDFEPLTANYIITAERGKRDEEVTRLKDQYGLDFWPDASTPTKAVFSTSYPYAAAPFWEYATPRAQAEKRLQWICREIDASRATDSNGHFEVPEDRELSDYQRADLAYMLRREGGVLDADEPGLGKTMTAIAYANEIRAKRVLIICPAQIRYQWLERWNDWSTMERYITDASKRAGYAIISSKLGLIEDAAVTVTSYGLCGVEGTWEALMAQQFDLLILDEAHLLKTMAAARTKAVFGGRKMKKDEFGQFHLSRDYGAGLVSRCKRVVELTGTPLPNRPLEAYVHAHSLCPESIEFMSEYAFKARFNPVEVKDVRVLDKELGVSVWKKFRSEESGRHAELQARMRAHFMCRHLKRDVLTQLKLPRYDLVRAEETSLVKAALHAESLLGIDPDSLTGEHAQAMGHIAEARRLMGLALAPQAVQYAGMLLDGGVDKLVIFYWHIEVGDILQKGLAKYGVCRIDGSSTPLVREAQKQRYLMDVNYRVMIGNVMSLGTGTDGLQNVSSYAFLAEADWVPGNNEQCVDRLDRRGQSQTVSADILVAPGSIAEKVLASSLRKRRVTHNTLDRTLEGK